MSNIVKSHRFQKCRHRFLLTSHRNQLQRDLFCVSRTGQPRKASCFSWTVARSPGCAVTSWRCSLTRRRSTAASRPMSARPIPARMNRTNREVSRITSKNVLSLPLMLLVPSRTLEVRAQKQRQRWIHIGNNPNYSPNYITSLIVVLNTARSAGATTAVN